MPRCAGPKRLKTSCLLFRPRWSQNGKRMIGGVNFNFAKVEAGQSDPFELCDRTTRPPGLRALLRTGDNHRTQAKWRFGRQQKTAAKLECHTLAGANGLQSVLTTLRRLSCVWS